MKISLAKQLNQLCERFETSSFIQDDPIQFPHRFTKREDVEIAAFLASIFAYGNRKIFIKKLDELFIIMDNSPLRYVVEGDFSALKGFNYRFAKDSDIINVFRVLNKLYSSGSGLMELFSYGVSLEGFSSKLSGAFQAVADYFYSCAKEPLGAGFLHLIPNPKNGGAMKRMCMFLRWMVRKGPVDLGIWEFISPAELLIPLDVHVARVSRKMELLSRSANDFKAVVELTENLKKIDAKDPVKFDFAIFGLGVSS